MSRSYDGGTEVHPGAGIPGREILGEWARPTKTGTHRVQWGSRTGGWWAHTSGSINDWPWVFENRAAAELAVAEMLAEHPAEEWTDRM